MRWLLTSLFLFLGAFALAEDTRLIMFEEEGCYWCEIWHAEIGEIYPKTPEGKRVPLMRVDLSDGIPKDIALKSIPFYTPTFVLVENGKEIGRIEGYPGEDFFWGLLGEMINALLPQRS